MMPESSKVDQWFAMRFICRHPIGHRFFSLGCVFLDDFPNAVQHILYRSWELSDVLINWIYAALNHKNRGISRLLVIVCSIVARKPSCFQVYDMSANRSLLRIL